MNLDTPVDSAMGKLKKLFTRRRIADFRYERWVIAADCLYGNGRLARSGHKATVGANDSKIMYLSPECHRYLSNFLTEKPYVGLYLRAKRTRENGYIIYLNARNCAPRGKLRGARLGCTIALGANDTSIPRLDPVEERYLDNIRSALDISFNHNGKAKRVRYKGYERIALLN